MIFSSYGFLFFFLPAFLFLYFAVRSAGSPRAIALLVIFASLVFYECGDGSSIIYLLASITVTYCIGSAIAANFHANKHKALMVIGLTVAILPLVILKYFSPLAMVFDIRVKHLGMPLAMSFLVFQQVIFLIEMARRNSLCPDFLDYLAAILFFPKLISGPLTSVIDLAEQFRQCKYDRSFAHDFSVGATYFCMGLFKKVVIADQMAPGVDSVFAGLDSGGVPFLDAWIGILSFFIMLYFDFSGYSDMAIGLARLCGFSLPANFNSPLKSTSLIDFWARWHMTLMKFLSGYVYNPIALWRTRSLMASPSSKGRLFLETAVFPSLVTMLVSGIWHGGGWNFIIFGLIHGVGLSVNHAWRQFKLPQLHFVIAWIVTFSFVLISLVLFRTSDPKAALTFAYSLAGLWEFRLPNQFAQFFSSVGMSVIVAPAGQNFGFFIGGMGGVMTTFAGLVWALVLPNSQQIIGEAKIPTWAHRICWKPNSLWALATAMLAIVSVSMFSSEYQSFIYFGF